MARDISGIVKVEGVVKAGCKVRCYLASRMQDATTANSSIFYETTTDAAGVYEFRNLAAGQGPGGNNSDTYIVVVLPPSDQVPDGSGDKFHALIKDKVNVS